MAGVDDMPRRCDLHPCSGRKRRRRIGMPSLPMEIIFKILLCLPADIIYNVMRYVCREWYSMIKDPIFIDAHFQESPAPTGMLVQFGLREYHTLYMEMGKHGIERTDLKWSQEGTADRKGVSWFWPQRQFSYYEKYEINCMKFPGMVLASCNGLVLVYDLSIMSCLHVVNPISKQWVKLPPSTHEILCRFSAGLAYVASCRKYKVVHAYLSNRDTFCAILTLGVDKAWRSISITEDISLPPEIRKIILTGKPYCVGGYIHWVYCRFVISLEVETESFRVSVAPMGKYNRRYFFSTESYLCYLGACEECIWEVWALTVVETGDWTMMQKIDLTAHKQMMGQQFATDVHGLIPLGLLQNGELVVYEMGGRTHKGSPIPYPLFSTLAISNVNAGSVELLDDGTELSVLELVACQPHVNSLISPKCV